eukprot:TRINITY_DN3678_c0_g1_i1.p1 TRINITY_DN3678_c0_g1~~TRINITY_DN3678_c0_g1_i1.p1  ORF type:complete len:690 (+),score=163.11 TRINITY_DN3678_c0_g1_i1:96-2165(+)
MLRHDAPSFRMTPDAPSFRPQKERKNKHQNKTPKGSGTTKKQVQKNNFKNDSASRELKLERTNSTGRNSKSNRSSRADHLLNFSAAPIDRTERALSWIARKPPSQTYRERREDVKKFLNTRFRFVLHLSASGNAENDDFWKEVAYVAYLSDPDTHCSICLDALVAPQVTKCGHMYCLPCLMRYYHTASETRWARCPVCFYTIDRREIKPVEVSAQLPVEQGSCCRLQLLKCPKIPPWIPVSPDAAPASALLSSSDPDARFSKQVRFCPEDGERLRECYREQLNQARIGEQDEGSLEFIGHADRVVEGMWSQAAAPILLHPVEPAPGPPEDQQYEQEFELPMLPVALLLKSRHHFKVSEEAAPAPALPEEATLGGEERGCEAKEGAQESSCEVGAQEEALEGVCGEAAEEEQGDAFFFQVADGQPVYLLPLNSKMLAHQFGSLSNAPREINLDVLEVEHAVVSPKLCSQHACLWNLPLGSDVCFLELDLAPLLSKDTLKLFGEELKQRVKKRKRAEAASKKSKQASKAGEIGQEFMNMHPQLAHATQRCEPAPDIDELQSFPSLDLSDAPSEAFQPKSTVPQSPTRSASFSTVAEHGFAGSAPAPVWDAECELGSTPTVQGVWAGKPAPGLAPSMGLGARGMERTLSGGEVEHGEIAAPTLSDFLFMGAAHSKKKKQANKGKKKRATNLE